MLPEPRAGVGRQSETGDGYHDKPDAGSPSDGLRMDMGQLVRVEEQGALALAHLYPNRRAVCFRIGIPLSVMSSPSWPHSLFLDLRGCMTSDLPRWSTRTTRTPLLFCGVLHVGCWDLTPWRDFGLGSGAQHLPAAGSGAKRRTRACTALALLMSPSPARPARTRWP